MRPKGSQFSLFDAEPFVSRNSTPDPVRSDYTAKKPFTSSHGEGAPWVDQKSLPNALPVIDPSTSDGNHLLNPDQPRNVTPDRYEWVPTWNMQTVQAEVTTEKLNSRHGNIDYGGYQEPEGQETRSDGDRQWGLGHADGKVTLVDGNHRTTLERHQGAMFHRINVRTTGMNSVDESEADVTVSGRYDP